MIIKLSGLLAGTEYAVQLRSNQDGAVSDWSRKFPLTTIRDQMPPATPTGFTWAVSGTAFKAKWNEVVMNQDGTLINDFSHYELELTNDTSTVVYRVSSLQFEFSFEMNVASFGDPSATVKARVSAVDDSGNRSDWTTQLSATNPPPAAPTGFSAAGLVDSVGLIWNEVNEDDLKGYSLHLSTTDPSFVPSSGNRVWFGSTTSVVYPTTFYGTDHYFKLAAVDVFGTPSSYVSDDARPNSSFGGDSSPPDQPTNIDVSGTQNAIDAGRADFTVSWDDPADTDLSHIVIRYRENGSGFPHQFVTVPAGEEEVVIKFLETDQDYDFQLSSVDFSANTSAWTTIITESVSATAPSKPSVPTISGSIQAFGVSHDLTKDGGGALESDVVVIAVYLSTTNSFGSATRFHSISVAPGSPVVVSDTITFPWPDSLSGTDLYVWVTAVSRNGLESPPSNSVSFNINSITGTYIANASIASAKIQNLEANKLVAGSGIIANLEVKSNLTVGDGTLPGSLRSREFIDSSGSSGWSLSHNNLIIRNGEISAAALRLQNSQNLMPPEYADFEFAGTFYTNDKFIIPASTTISIISTAKYGGQALLVNSTSSTSRTIDLAPPATYNIIVEEGETYIASMWVYNGHATLSRNVALRISWGNGSVSNGTNTSIPPNTWGRISNVAVTPSGVSSARVGMTYANTSTSYRIDGVQFERQETGQSTPSIWKPPSFTSIDGGIMRTGEIRSSQTVNVNGVDQPLWSINLSGAAQFGSANVRGSLIVGPTGGTDGGQSDIRSGNFSAGSTGWRIQSNGAAEFNNVDVRGNLVVNNASIGSVSIVNSNFILEPSNDARRTTVEFDSVPALATRGWIRHSTFNSLGIAGYEQTSFAIQPGKIGSSLIPVMQVLSGTVNGVLPPSVTFGISGSPTKMNYLIGGTSSSIIQFAGTFDALGMRPKTSMSTTTQTVTDTDWTYAGADAGHTFVAPESGVVRIDFQYYFGISMSAQNVFRQIHGSIRVGTGSTIGGGTQIVAPSANYSVTFQHRKADTTEVDVRMQASSYHIVTGLTPGNTYNVGLYRNTNVQTSATYTDFARKVTTTPQM